MAVIGVFDSGSGGLSVLREIRKILPEQRFIYFSDNAYCPYGEKTAEFVTGRSRAVTDLLLSKGASTVVLACNTATAAAIATLRSEYKIPFVGMEPAVKPAASGTRSGIVGVLATAGTLRAPKYLNTKGQYADAVRIVERVGLGFVELVENLELDGPHAESVVRASLEPLLDAGADTIVLGCTHYPFLLPLMQRIAPPEVNFIDPAPAVARHLADVLVSHGIPLTDSDPGVELLASGPDTTLKKLFTLI
jgi:glutamate racemase